MEIVLKAVPTISIHTPARGVTGDIAIVPVLNVNFNPHSRKGSDVLADLGCTVTSEFQSTLPQGE